MNTLLNRSQHLSASAKLIRMPWIVLVMTAVLAASGAATLYSVANGAYEPWAAQHVGRFLALSAVVIIMVILPLEVWVKLSYPLYAVALIALLAVPFVGVEAMGARRWLGFGSIQFQPSELMKLAIVMALARFFHGAAQDGVSSLRSIAVCAAIVGVPVFLVLDQPDLGSAVLLLILGLGLIYLAGVSLIYFAAGGIAVASLLPILLASLHDYQRKRLTTFFDPDSDPLGAGYHILQSKIALGSGGLSGRGFMKGTQSQLDFLPEKHTDFIFTMIGEEWGYAGSLSILIIYAMLLLVLARMALRSETVYGRLVIGGAFITLFLYVFINVAMVTGLVPVVGIPLPLVSYGGTSMTTIMIGLGLACSAYVDGGASLGWAGGRRL